MGDSRIQDLTPIPYISAQDHFVLEHDEDAYNLTGQVLINWLTSAADGHGGIKTPWHKVNSEGLKDTYEAELADGTKTTFTVTNGESGVHYGSDLPLDIQDVWVVTDPQQTDEVFAELDARYERKGEGGAIDDTKASKETTYSPVKTDQRYAPALVKTVQGEVVAVDDVSPLPQELKCTISGVPDLSAVMVSRLGTSIWNGYKPKDDINTEMARCRNDAVTPCPKSYWGKTVTFRALMRVYKQFSEKQEWYITLWAADKDGRVIASKSKPIIDRIGEGTIDANVSLVIPEGTTQIWSGGTNKGLYFIYEDRMLCFGGVKPFEPYTKTDYASNSEGIVSGMTPLSPNMTLLTDTPDALIDLTYNADLYQNFKKLSDRLAVLESAQTQI